MPYKFAHRVSGFCGCFRTERNPFSLTKFIDVILRKISSHYQLMIQSQKLLVEILVLLRKKA